MLRSQVRAWRRRRRLLPGRLPFYRQWQTDVIADTAYRMADSVECLELVV
jgi:hypothetical protein